VTIALVFVATAAVMTVKVALVAPAAIVTLAGTPATAGLPLESATMAPPCGAPAESVTRPCDAVPPTALVGLTETLCRLAAAGAAVTVSVAVLLVPLVAVIVTPLLVVTTAVVTANGGKVVGGVKHPLNTSDFSSFLLQAQSSKAKIIGLANAGGDTTNSI